MPFKNRKSYALNFAVILALLGGMFGVVPAVQASTLSVTNTNDSGAGSLRQAITTAVSGDTIIFNPALSGQTITLTSGLTIDKDLTIDGSALASKISVSGNNSVRVFYVNPDITVTIDALIIRNGISTSYGGGIQNRGILTVLNSTFSENSVSGNDAQTMGGAIANYDGVLSVAESIFSSNSAEYDPNAVGGGYGGAIYSLFGVLTVTDSVFDGNHASRGGAIVCEVGTMTVTDSAFFSNSAISLAAADGGAIFQYCNSTIANSTFSDNSASLGGAIHTDNNVNSLVIANSTFHGNTASTAGGSIVNYGGLAVVNSTFSNNSSPSGGAIKNGLGGTLSLRNSILANSVGGVDCIKSDGTPEIENINNLIETTGTDFESCGASDLSSDPMLGALANNGGPTQTMELLPGSPAIDTGNDANCPSTDQRGVIRPQGSHCDIGAYESEYSPVDVIIGNSEVGSYSLAPQESQRKSYSGVNAGPVKIINTDSVSIMAAERVIYKINGVNTSFSEMMGLPDSQLDNTYWLPWYNNVDLDTQLRFANVSGAEASVHVSIGGTEVPGSPFTLAAGASTRRSFVGINNGPVEIESDVDIVAAERLIYKVNGINTSFSEMMGLPASQLDNTYWLPWYNNVDLDTQLRFANVSGAEASVHVSIGGTEMPGSPFTLAAGASTRKSFAGINNGPVKIESDQNIVAAERVIYKVNGVNTSFSEMMGLPDNQLNTTYWLPWYNNVDLDTQLRFANVSGAEATVHVYIGGTEMPGSPFTLAAGASTRVSFAGINNGPVEIVSDVDIVAAERVIYKINGVNTSFSEMMGLPASQLDNTYWLPWYNNVDLDTQLRFGVP